MGGDPGVEHKFPVTPGEAHGGAAGYGLMEATAYGWLQPMGDPLWSSP